MPPVVAIGCTGVIGSGKSTVCALLGRSGATVIDVDAHARAVTRRGGEAFVGIVESFGASVLTEEGDLDRPALATMAFSDPECRRTLEELVHPFVEAKILHDLATTRDDVVVVDHPLLVETGARARLRLDGVLVVDVPYDLARGRLVDGRGMLPEEVAQRIAAQCTREERLRAADFILMNMGTMAELEEMVGRAWQWIEQLES